MKSKNILENRRKKTGRSICGIICQCDIFIFDGYLCYRINYAILNVEKIRLRRNTVHINTYVEFCKQESKCLTTGVGKCGM